MASSSAWWGASADEDRAEARSIIRCTPSGQGFWDVRVSDAVGAVSVGDLDIVVDPKIPAAHLIHLLEASNQVPRLGDAEAHLDPDRSFWDLVARWYIAAMEGLLRRDLVRDYRRERATLGSVRGTVDVRRTLTNLLKGTVGVTCEFEEFDQNNPLNRVLLAAIKVVAGSPVLTEALRRRALRIAYRMDGIGTPEPGDGLGALERRTVHYREPVALALHILAGTGRALEHGKLAAHSFLFRTPELVEEGVRNLLLVGLEGTHQVVKRGLQLGQSGVSLTPDLVFDGGVATGDVKYKLYKSDWFMSDLYQAVAFATAFRARSACVVGFQTASSARPPSVPVGEVVVTPISWKATNGIPAQESAATLVHDVSKWLSAESQN
jgi:5-methylcytosine-specific restriction enzyme subunit McrC